MFKKILTIVLILGIATFAISCGGNNTEEPKTDNGSETSQPADNTTPASETTENPVTPPVEDKPATQEPEMINGTIVAFETNIGNFEITLWDADAPIASGNLVEKAKAGSFNGLTFHRIVKGFVIQGGDPKGDGSGGGVMQMDKLGLHSNKTGTIAMASASQSQPITDQSDYQFFINLADNANLDTMGFVAFGEVSSGIDVVNKIAESSTTASPWGENSQPVNKILMNKVYIK